MAIEIIKLGTAPVEKKIEKTCSYCNTVFTYQQEDIQSDFRDGSYVICPNPNCGKFLSASHSDFLNKTF